MKTYSRKEEMANSLTHGAGLAASIVGFVLLMHAVLDRDTLSIWVAGIYGFSLILCYGTSTLYHSFHGSRIKHIFKTLDHAAIYLLIAGTYTPFAFFVIPSNTGMIILTVVWSIAIVGVIFKIFFVHRFRLLSTFAYLGMGWLAVFAINPLFQNLDTVGFWLLIAGGLSYSFGVVFFLWEKLPYNHAIWHIFVMAGSLCHFLSVWGYAIPV
jgi:hemolysin III